MLAIHCHFHCVDYVTINYYKENIKNNLFSALGSHQKN